MAGKAGIIQIIRDSLWNPNYDREVVQDPWLNPANPFNQDDVNVTVDSGTKLATVFSSVNLLAQDVSHVPFNVHRRGDKSKEALFNDPISRLIRNPNNYMTKYPYWYSQVWLYLTQGESFSWIQRGMDGVAEALIPFKPGAVQLVLQNGKVFAQIQGVSTVIPYDDIFHLKLYTFDGINGVSPITWNSGLIGKKIKENKFATRALGQKPVGFLKGDVKDGQVPNIVKAWQDANSGGGEMRTPFLVGDIDYKALSISPNEAQYIETQIETRKEIYSLFRINPTLISNFDQGVQANADQQSLNHTKYTLAPHYVMIEEEVNKKLLTDQFFSKHNINAFLRGDVKTRKELYQFMRTGGIATGNEIRALEDMPPSSDPLMDEIFIQGAMTQLDKAGVQPKKTENEL